MADDIRVNGRIFSVEREHVEKAVYELMDGTDGPEEIRKFLTEKEVTTPIFRKKEASDYVDFDDLTEDKKPRPVIVGNYYRNTSYGRKLCPDDKRKFGPSL